MRRTFLRPLAAMVLAAGLTGGDLVQAGPPVDDETIFTEVEGVIRRAHSLAGADITVEAREGVVRLGGFARTMEDIATADRLARQVRGVTAVKNAIRIANRPSRA